MSDCPYCKALQNKENVLYEDEKLAVVFPEKTLTKGHLQIIPKEHKTTLQDYEDKDTEHLFYAASFTATALFENLQAHGTNIIANTGSRLNPNTHFHIDVIARWADDKINFLWTPKKLPEEEMKSVQGMIKDKTDMIGIEQKKKEPIILDKKPEKIGPKKEMGTQENRSEKEKDTAADDTDINETDTQKDRNTLKDKSTLKDESTAKENSEKSISQEHPEESYLIRQLRRIP